MAISLRLPKDLEKQLKSLSKARGEKVSDLMREALRRYLLVRDFESWREKLSPYGRAQGVVTDEDVFARFGRS